MIYIGADHRGFELKEKLVNWLKTCRYEVEDLGNNVLDSEDDYPDFAKKVAKKIKKESDLGILICGSGAGMDIVANKFPGVRCGTGFNSQQIRIAKRDDGLNCLSLPADYISLDEAKAIVSMFLETKFANSGKYLRRVKKIE